MYKWGCAYTNKLKKSANHFLTAKTLNTVCFFCCSLNMFCLSICEHALLLIRKVVPAAQLVDQDTNKKKKEWVQLTLRKDPPPSLLLLCLTSLGALTPHTIFSHSKKYIAEQGENRWRADRQDGAGYFWYETKSQLLHLGIFNQISTINTVSWHFNVL